MLPFYETRHVWELSFLLNLFVFIIIIITTDIIYLLLHIIFSMILTIIFIYYYYYYYCIFFCLLLLFFIAFKTLVNLSTIVSNPVREGNLTSKTALRTMKTLFYQISRITAVKDLKSWRFELPSDEESRAKFVPNRVSLSVRRRFDVLDE